MGTRLKESKVIFWIWVAGLAGLSLFWPGDVPWINDEPKLIYKAFESNLHHTFINKGLYGFYGTPYGPLPVWIYKFFLFFSTNLVLLAFFKTLLTLILVFIPLYFIARQLGLNSYFLLLLFVSPYLCFYARLLWDNCYLIPLSAWLLFFLLKFTVTDRLVWFAACLLSVVFLLDVHLMSLLIVAPLFLYFLLYKRELLAAQWRETLCIFLASFLLLTPYISALLFESHRTAHRWHPTVAAWYQGLMGAKFFTFLHFDYYVVPEMMGPDFVLPAGLYRFLKLASCAAFIFLVAGSIRIAMNVAQKAIHRVRLSREEEFQSFLVMTLLAASIWFVVSGIPVHPHFYSAVSSVYFLLICFGLDLHWNRRIVRFVFWGYFLSMFILFVSFLWYIHISGGNRGIHFGPTLQNQIDIVKQVDSFRPASLVRVDVDNFRYFPQSLGVLHVLYGKPVESRQGSFLRKIAIVYRDEARTGWVKLNITEP